MRRAYQEAPDRHQTDGGHQRLLVVLQRADASDQQQSGRHDKTATENHWAATDAVNERPGAHVAQELHSKRCLSDADRVLDARETEVVPAAMLATKTVLLFPSLY